ncbi:TlpA disulfide reductase family protein [uncultured Apibacter sp.]|uniref:TlpA family protein disulfide reductase n=1 Tax=uncultured Apibacter sp. TaxID=1778616 RepID=UPI0025D7B005|nr:TlpA disulfide reductase family protein [uncultured Apibacter sp.]
MVKRFYAIIFFILSLGIGKAQKLASTDSIKNIKVIAFSDLKEIIKKNDDKLLVVNFWATWCMPCVMEIPTFMKINEKYKNNVGYKMVLINLNQVENIEFVKKFIKKYSISTEVYLINDLKNIEEWIPSIDPSWAGSIPATAFYKKSIKILFKERSLNEKELDSIINQNL